jgi:ABC-type lipoprotein export system ATPase subunit
MGHRPGGCPAASSSVAIARALVGRPRLILADEPTGNLDPKTSEVIWDLFLRLQAERRLAFVIATHNHTWRGGDRGYRWWMAVR